MSMMSPGVGVPGAGKLIPDANAWGSSAGSSAAAGAGGLGSFESQQRQQQQQKQQQQLPVQQPKAPDSFSFVMDAMQNSIK